MNLKKLFFVIVITCAIFNAGLSAMENESSGFIAKVKGFLGIKSNSGNPNSSKMENGENNNVGVDEKTCAICYEALEGKYPEIFNLCSIEKKTGGQSSFLHHTFHFECLVKLRQNTPAREEIKCPYCRNKPDIDKGIEFRFAQLLNKDSLHQNEEKMPLEKKIEDIGNYAKKIFDMHKENWEEKERDFQLQLIIAQKMISERDNRINDLRSKKRIQKQDFLKKQQIVQRNFKIAVGAVAVLGFATAALATKLYLSSRPVSQ
jgi:hypothetical protein